MENDPFIDGLPIKMVIFHGYVKQPEGNNIFFLFEMFFSFFSPSIFDPWSNIGYPDIWGWLYHVIPAISMAL